MSNPKDIIGIVRGIVDNSRILEGFNDETISMKYGTWKSIAQACLTMAEALDELEIGADHYTVQKVRRTKEIISSLSVK